MAYKHDYDRILTRLTIILSRLNDGEALSVTELAKEFNVSDRTIQRDFNERLISFPVYQDKKKWRMQEGFRLEKSTSVEDTVVLDIMEKLIEGAGQKFSMKAAHLLSKIKNQTHNPFYAKLDIEDIGDKLKEVQQLESAIRKKQEISSLYDFEGFSKKIALKPLKIANYEGFWYLIALDARNDTLKKYHLRSIKKITMNEKSFTTDRKLDTLLDNAISIWFDENVVPYSVRLELSSVVAKYFKRKPVSKTQKIEEMREDGSMVISMKITHDMEIIPLVKHWLPNIKILEPQSIKDDLEKELKDYMK